MFIISDSSILVITYLIFQGGPLLSKGEDSTQKPPAGDVGVALASIGRQTLMVVVVVDFHYAQLVAGVTGVESLLLKLA